MKEEWRDIQGFEGLYQISDKGNVRSSYQNNFRGTTFSKILKQKKNSNGYMEVTLCKNGKKYSVLVHRIVAIAFIPNPFDLPKVNHKDEDKSNPSADNLEWCTQQYNATYGNGPKVKNTKVRQLDLSGNQIRTWDSMKDAETVLGIKYQLISACCRHVHKTAVGYIWRYESEVAA